ncbi:MAG: hypothetical protein AB1393_03565 [Candidatus Edwardsbacteria bacterium]
MRLRSKLVITLLLQLIGAISTLFVSIIVTRRYGAEAQGYLSYYRSAVDLFANTAIFGFPQAFIYMINTKILNVDFVVKFINRYCSLFGLVFVIIAIVAYTTGIAESTGFNLLAVLSLAVASFGMMLHGMYRSVCLSTKSNYIFNLVSIMPAFFIFLIYFIWHAVNYEKLVLASVFASIISFLFPMFIFKKSIFGKWTFDKELVGKVAKYGFWSFIPSVAASLCIVGTYAILRRGGISDATCGNFSISVLFITASVTPLNMIAPILFNDWAGEKWKKGTVNSYSLLSHLGLVIALAGVMFSVVLVRSITAMVFGEKLLGSTESTRVLLFGLFAFYQNRLLSSLLLAVGNPSATAVGWIIKTATVFSALYLGLSSSLTGAALAWVIGEFASMIYMCVVASQETGWPITRIAGVSPSRAFEMLRSS